VRSAAKQMSDVGEVRIDIESSNIDVILA